MANALSVNLDSLALVEGEERAGRGRDDEVHERGHLRDARQAALRGAPALVEEEGLEAAEGEELSNALVGELDAVVEGEELEGGEVGTHVGQG